MTVSDALLYKRAILQLNELILQLILQLRVDVGCFVVTTVTISR